MNSRPAGPGTAEDQNARPSTTLRGWRLAAAEELKFEYAAKLREEIKDLERQL